MLLGFELWGKAKVALLGDVCNRDMRVLLAVGAGSLHHGAEILVRSVSSALVSGGEDEASAFGRIVDGFFAGSHHIGNAAAQHHLGGMEIPRQGYFLAV